jgi:hypothetical protein
MEWETNNSQPIEALCPYQQQLTRRPSLEGFLTREELAGLLRISVRTLNRWDALREGPPRVSQGRTILYKADSVRHWLSNKERVTIPSGGQRRRKN